MALAGQLQIWALPAPSAIDEQACVKSLLEGCSGKALHRSQLSVYGLGVGQWFVICRLQLLALLPALLSAAERNKACCVVQHGSDLFQQLRLLVAGKPVTAPTDSSQQTGSAAETSFKPGCFAISAANIRPATMDSLLFQTRAPGLCRRAAQLQWALCLRRAWTDIFAKQSQSLQCNTSTVGRPGLCRRTRLPAAKARSKWSSKHESTIERQR